MMDRDPNVNHGLTGEVRVRVPLPIIVPFGALILIALLSFGFSRILLSVPKEIATVVAMVTAANVVGACAVLALRRNMNRSVMSELAIVVLYPVLVGAVIATMGLDTGHGEEHSAAEPATAPAGAEAEGNTVTASGTAFDTDELTLKGGETAQIEFINEDAAPHNIAIYETEAAEKDIFVGEVINDDTITYELDVPKKPDEAFFRCDIHPAMNGTVVIE